MRKHLIIPDAQIRPGADTRHIDWAAQAIVEHRPDVLTVIGDWWDFGSLNGHSEKGSEELEGSRYQDDVDAGNEAFRRLVAPMDKAIKQTISGKRKQWRPRKVFITGNHEHRADRVAQNDPKWKGIIGSHHCQTLDFERHPFLKIVDIDGILYSHYFPNPFSGRPIGGSVVSRLNNIGQSFVQGHQQGLLYGSRQYPSKVMHGLVCGRFYIDHESYRPPDVQRTEWSGIVILNDVHDGSYDFTPLSMSSLERKYG